MDAQGCRVTVGQEIRTQGSVRPGGQGAVATREASLHLVLDDVRSSTFAVEEQQAVGLDDDVVVGTGNGFPGYGTPGGDRLLHHQGCEQAAGQFVGHPELHAHPCRLSHLELGDLVLEGANVPPLHHGETRLQVPVIVAQEVRQVAALDAHQIRALVFAAESPGKPGHGRRVVHLRSSRDLQAHLVSLFLQPPRRHRERHGSTGALRRNRGHFVAVHRQHDLSGPGSAGRLSPRRRERCQRCGRGLWCAPAGASAHGPQP